ncbi:hypothetical protein [Microbacterium indicum]|uniref:hypothetical protein n=1 Tax=Microbacterium indicum TaxID=358100 RepID=UPI00040D54B3|nr:hypothetical protein [Microbacterium indicum]
MATETAARRAAPIWLRGVVFIVFGVLYAYAIWAGITYLIVMASTASAYGGSLTPVAWIAMIMTMVVPVVSYAASAILGRGRALWALGLMLLTGLALTGVFWLDVQALTSTQVVFS